MNKFLLAGLVLALLASCSSTKEKSFDELKNDCRLKGEALACHKLGKISMTIIANESEHFSTPTQKDNSANWFRLGCEYNHALSCYEYARYLSFHSPKRAKAYMDKSCKLEKLDHCH